MSSTRYKLTFSFEKKSNQDIQSGLGETDKQVGMDKGKKLTMYLAVISLVAAVVRFSAVVLDHWL
ncbi:hypothetical protein NX774_13640 [Massilia agilis]|uniref:Uncharacterized protein n=1 Tax=Massilia agilis TaxID=1811226 RepID=A0ABT2DCT1_9BURK|nr:hypothetical protein [Massilia agilis]MCS0808967.1 hypothetical protein [Massilia agilis]